MLRVANSSAAEFHELGNAVQFSGQTAKDAGLDFNSYIASLAATAGALAVSVESVSQGYQEILGKLASVQSDVGRGQTLIKDAFEKTGIATEDVLATMDGSRNGFLNFIKLLADAKLESHELTAVLRALSGSTYGASFSYLVQNPEELDRTA